MDGGGDGRNFYENKLKRNEPVKLQQISVFVR